MSGFSGGFPFEITPATADEAAITDSFSNMSDPSTFGGHSGGWFDDWNWGKIASGAKDLKAGLSDITKLNGTDKQAQQQRLQAGQPQTNRGQGGTSIEELLQQLQARRQALAQLGLQPGPFEPRAPGANLFGLIRGAR